MTAKQILEGVAKDLELRNWWETLTRADKDQKVNLHIAAEFLPKTEQFAAERLAQKFGQHVSYVSSEDTWYVWDGRIHRPVQERALPRLMVTYLHQALTTALGVVKTDADILASAEVRAKDGTEADMAALMKRHYYDQFSEARYMRDRLASTAGQTAVIAQLKDLLEAPHDHFLDDSRWIVVRNGVYDMDAVRRDREWKLLEHDPSRPVYRLFDFEDVHGNDLDLSTWNAGMTHWLNTSVQDREQSHFLIKAVAGALLGARGDTRRIVSIQGAPSSGKSMFLRVMEGFCQGTGYYVTPGHNAILKEGVNREWARWDMARARVVMFSEVRKQLDQEFILNYAGGDPFEVQRKYVNGYQATPQGIIFVANNHALGVDKSDSAMAERLAPITFPHSFTTTDPVHTKDPNLEAKILADRPGIFQMLKQAYLDFLDDIVKHGEYLPKSDQMQLTVLDEAEDEDLLSEFLLDRSLTAQDVSASRSMLYSDLRAAYVEWCRDRGYPVATDRELKTMLTDRGLPIRRSNGTRVMGIPARQ